MTSFKFIFCLLISVPIGTVLQYTIASIHHAQKCTRNLCLHCLLKAYSFKNRYRLKVNLTDSLIKIYKYIVEFINSKSYTESVLHARRPFHQFLVLCELSSYGSYGARIQFWNYFKFNLQADLVRKLLSGLRIVS